MFREAAEASIFLLVLSAPQFHQKLNVFFSAERKALRTTLCLTLFVSGRCAVSSTLCCATHRQGSWCFDTPGTLTRSSLKGEYIYIKERPCGINNVFFFSLFREFCRDEKNVNIFWKIEKIQWASVSLYRSILYVLNPRRRRTIWDYFDVDWAGM